MSISTKCPGLCVGCENVIPSPFVLSEMNAVLGRMDTRPTSTNMGRVCKSPMWIRASSATRWPTERTEELYEKV